ncbi:hypothetical protein RSSM_03067 [Rhodopirellula sallentina SM41]|uniref:Uncharacterized protein n=1 Tax=Rhodopirellula sallentina SM41 TaxID=1263870 RepID=M5UHJ4_9BACT|nr:hypothetical protein RSSM_03067 [Rhodopirellula sallentina SM41]
MQGAQRFHVRMETSAARADKPDSHPFIGACGSFGALGSESQRRHHRGGACRLFYEFSTIGGGRTLGHRSTLKRGQGIHVKGIYIKGIRICGGEPRHVGSIKLFDSATMHAFPLALPSGERASNKRHMCPMHCLTKKCQHRTCRHLVY